MGKRHLNHFEQLVSSPDELSDDQLKLLFLALMKRLKIKIVKESTPDYVSVELVDAEELQDD